MRLSLLATLSLPLALSVSGWVQAEGDPEAGKQKAAVCAACHGQNGISAIPSYPNIAGQKEQYLVESLKAYKEKKRQGGQAPVMQAQAQALSEQDIEDLAAYYSAQSCK